MTFEEFTEHYEKYGICKGDAFKSKKKWNKKQLNTKYKKYMKQFNEEGNTQDQILREIVVKRDVCCRLNSVLTREELYLYGSSSDGCFDVANVFGKSAFPHMGYLEDNVVLLSREFHSRLDAGKNPLTGKTISKEEHEGWWIRIVGEDKYKKLKEIARDGN